MTDPVDGCHVNAVRDGVGALDGLPGARLSRAEFRFFRRMPADRGGIEEDAGAFEGGQHGFRIPLIPTNERTDRAYVVSNA